MCYRQDVLTGKLGQLFRLTFLSITTDYVFRNLHIEKGYPWNPCGENEDTFYIHLWIVGLEYLLKVMLVTLFCLFIFNFSFES